MRQAGFSLTELVVVMAIAAILLAMATHNWNTWTRKSAIERETKSLYADLVATRLDALYTKRPRSVTVCGAQFSVYSSTVTSVSAVTRRALTYPLRSSEPGGTLTITFDAAGLSTATAETALCLDPANNLSEGNPGAVDCVVITTARTKLGKRQGGLCDAASITQK